MERLSVRAELDESGEELARARERAGAGDRDWGDWVDAHDRGDAAIVLLSLVVAFGAGGERREIVVHNSDVWVEKRRHRPEVETQLADAVSKDYGPVAEALRTSGVDVSARQLEEMHIHVDVRDEVMESLRSADAPQGPPGGCVGPDSEFRMHSRTRPEGGGSRRTE